MKLPSMAFMWGACVRAIKTFIQSVAAMLTTAQIGILSIHWSSVASVAGVASVVSLMTSFAALDQITEVKAPSPEAPAGAVLPPAPLELVPIVDAPVTPIEPLVNIPVNPTMQGD